MPNMEDIDLSVVLERLKLCTEVPEATWQVGKSAVNNSYIPIIEAGSDRPLHKADFQDIVPIIEINLKNVYYLVKMIADIVKNSTAMENSKNINTSFVISVLILCGEHRVDNLWTSETTRCITDEILNIMCEMKGCENTSGLFVGPGSLLKKSFVSLRPKLLKNNFKKFPAAISCYKWLLFHIKPSGTQFSDPLSYILPTALILVDDFLTENQLLGLECIQHIMSITNSTELSWHGEGEMTYKAVERLLHLHEHELIIPMYSCMVNILQCVEGSNKGKQHISTNWSKYDDVFDIIFRSMELEQSVHLKIAYIESLKKLMGAAGLFVIRWTKRLLNIIKDYIEVAGYSEYLLGVPTLEVLVIYLKCDESRAGRHAEDLFYMLFKALYDFTHAPLKKSGSLDTDKDTSAFCIDPDLQKTTVGLIKACLYRLKKLNTKVAKEISEHSLQEGVFGEDFEIAFHDVFD